MNRQIIEPSDNSCTKGVFMKDCILYEFQAKIVNRLIENENIGCHLQFLNEKMGSGKTLMALSLISNSMNCPVEHHILPFFNDELDEPPQEIPINLIICNRHIIDHWINHIKAYTHFTFCAITTAMQLSTINSENIGMYDIVLISNSIIKCNPKEIAMTDYELLSIENAGKYNLIDMFLIKFGSPVFNRVIIDDFTEFKKIKSLRMPIGRSNILISSTLGYLNTGINNCEYGTYNNILSYINYSMFYLGYEVPTIRCNSGYKNDLDFIPKLQIFEIQHKVQTFLNCINALIAKEPELAHEISIMTIDPFCSIEHILHRVLITPEEKIAELDANKDKYEISILRHKLETRRNMILSKECPLCFDDECTECYYHACCHCTICTDCFAEERRQLRTVCPNCGRHFPFTIQINKEKIKCSTDVPKMQNVFYTLINNIRNGIMDGTQIPIADLECDGVSCGTYYIEPPEGDRLIAIIVENKVAEENIRKSLGDEEFIKLTYKNYAEIAKMQMCKKIIILNTSEISHGIELPNITDLIISHEFKSHMQLSQAIGRVQRLTREYSCNIYKIKNMYD